MQFRLKFFWEFIQNLPVIGGFLLALQLWRDTHIISSITVMVVGAFFSTVLIRFTERNIIGKNHGAFPENLEPVTVTITNFGLMLCFILALTLYLTASWSNSVIDLLLGVLIALVLSAGQSKAAGSSIGWRHTLAFAAAFPIALITIRFSLTLLPLIFSILLVNTIVTLIITAIDYGHLFTIGEGAN